MAAWDKVLGEFKQPNDPDQQQKDKAVVLGIAQAEGGSDRRKSREPLQAGGSPSDGPKLNRREREDSNGNDEQPRNPTEESLGWHVGCFSRLHWTGHGSFAPLTARRRIANFREGAFMEPDKGAFERIRKMFRSRSAASE